MTGDPALDISTAPPAREGSTPPPRWAETHGTRAAITKATAKQQREEGKAMCPPEVVHTEEQSSTAIWYSKKEGRDGYSLRVLPILAMISCPSILLPS